MGQAQRRKGFVFGGLCGGRLAQNLNREADVMTSRSLLDFSLYHLPYSDEEERLGMLCTTVGSANVRPGVLYPQDKSEHPDLFRPVKEGRTLPEFQLVYVTSGEGFFSLGADIYNVRPGSIMLVLPGMLHAYCPLLESGWHEYWVGFKGGYFSRLLEEGILSQEKVFFQIGVNDAILSIFCQIFDEVRIQRPFYQMKACSRILDLISEILTREKRQENQKEQENYHESVVAKTKHMMETNVYGSLNLSSIYEQLGISASNLNEIFKSHTSMTPYQYFIKIKTHKAKLLLEQEGLTIKEVAHRIGFDDQYYFSRLFKSKTGFSPVRWRKNIRHC